MAMECIVHLSGSESLQRLTHTCTILSSQGKLFNVICWSPDLHNQCIRKGNRHHSPDTVRKESEEDTAIQWQKGAIENGNRISLNAWILLELPIA